MSNQESELQARAVTAAVVALRLVVGWHFLYEGLWKVMQRGGWSSLGYLTASASPAAPLFKWIAAHGWMVQMSDQLVQWGLVAMGLGLITGVLARYAAVFGMMLLSFFYLAQPPTPFPGASSAFGHFFLIDENVLEMAGLLVVAAVPAPCVFSVFKRSFAVPAVSVLTLLVFGGAFYLDYRSGTFAPKPDATTSATVRKYEFEGGESIKAPLKAKARLGTLEVPRVIIAGEYFSGRSHGRDLIWTDEFMRRYNSVETLRRTFDWAHIGRLDAISGSPELLGRLRENGVLGREALFISDCSGSGEFELRVKKSLRDGAGALFTPPEETDQLADKRDVELLRKMFQALKDTKVPYGIGCHKLSTLKFCVENGLVPDFWCIAYHPLNYPSALPKVSQKVKSVWCADPEGVIEFMKTRKEPWVALNAAAFGGLKPPDAIVAAKKAGAACVCLDVLDFQVVEVVKAAVGAFDGQSK